MNQYEYPPVYQDDRDPVTGPRDLLFCQHREMGSRITLPLEEGLGDHPESPGRCPQSVYSVSGEYGAAQN